MCEDIRRASEVLQRSFPQKDIQMFGDRLHVLVQGAQRKEKEILASLKKEHVTVRSSRIVPASLEDVFIASLNT